MLDGARRAKLEHPASVPHSSNGMKKTKFLYPRPFRLSHNPRHRLSREPGAHRVSGRAAVPGRSRGGNAAGNFHPRPGPASRLPRTGRGHRGGPDDRARPPAGRWEGAIHLLYEVPTQRPASQLPQKPDGEIRAWRRRSLIPNALTLRPPWRGFAACRWRISSSPSVRHGVWRPPHIFSEILRLRIRSDVRFR